MITQLRKDLRLVATPKKAETSAWFFKTGKGQYGYGDKFLGVTLPEQRIIAKKYADLKLPDIELLLQSEFHEERMTGLIILVNKYLNVLKKRKSKKEDKRELELKRQLYFEFYISHTKYINNWDLVDATAHFIVGNHLLDKKITLLLSLAKSESLWERRIAVVATFAFINSGDSTATFRIADILLEDREDLIQKAVGWMLREVGKRISEKELEEYLATHYKKMGRTALRYAIERFDEKTRKKYLLGVI